MNVICTSDPLYAGDFNAAHAAAVLAGASIFVDAPCSLTASLLVSAAVGSIDFFGSATLEHGNYDMTGPGMVEIRGPRRQLFTFSGTGRLKGTFGNEFHMEHFGADPTLNPATGTQTRLALQYLFDYIGQSARPAQRFRGWGHYFFDNVTVVKNSSFYCPTFEGCPGISTIFESAPTTPTPILQIVGGTGVMAYARLDDIMILGNANTIGIEIVGQSGVHGRVGFISGMNTAVKLTGTLGNSSPEDNVFDLFSQDAGNTQPMLMHRDPSCVGTASFSQSGLGDHTNIARHTGSGISSVLKIDDPSCAAYNGSFGGYFWNDCGFLTNLVENHSAGFPCTFPRGNVRMEANTVTPFAVVDARYNIAYFRHMPFVQGSHSVDLSNAAFPDYLSYLSSILTRKGATYEQGVSLGYADAIPLNIPQPINGEQASGILVGMFCDPDQTWMWQGIVFFWPGDGNGEGGAVAFGTLLRSGTVAAGTAGWGNPIFDSMSYAGQLRLKGFTGTPTHVGIAFFGLRKDF